MKLIVLLLIFSTVMNAQKFDIEGHRGCRGLKPENTIEAFLHAVDLGVNTLELDVCITKDGKVVVSHEPYMNSLFSSHPDGRPVLKDEENGLNIYKMDYETVKKYDSGKRGNVNFKDQEKLSTYKPLLSEVFETIETYLKAKKLPLVNYNVEIKSEEQEYNISQPKVPEFSKLVYKQILDYGLTKRVILQSFDFEVLKYWKKNIVNRKYKKVRLAALVESDEIEPSLGKLGFNPDIYSPYFKLLSKQKVEMLQNKGIKVIPWTVNEIVDIKNTIKMGVNGIISDYPDRLIQVVNQK